MIDRPLGVVTAVGLALLFGFSVVGSSLESQLDQTCQQSAQHRADDDE